MLTKKAIDATIKEAKQSTEDLVYVFTRLLFQAQDELNQACKAETPQPAIEAAEILDYVRITWAQNSMEKRAEAA